MRSLYLVLALAFGCADSSPRHGVGSGTSPPIPISLAGRYAIRSELDLSMRLPAEPGDLIRVVIDATDDPDDPARFLVDHALAALPPSAFADALRDAEPIVIAYVEERIATTAPLFAARLRAFGAALDRATRGFATIEELDVLPSGIASHAIRGVRVSGVELLFRDHAVPDGTPGEATIALDALDRATIGSHRVAVPYGRTLRLMIERGIVPSIDPAATSVFELLRDSVDCPALGATLASALSLDDGGLFGAACTSGLVDVARAFDARLDAVADVPLAFDLQGSATALVVGRETSAFEAGAWTGAVGEIGMEAPLGAATFAGMRM
jgi:hypothetical protein